jgi:chromate reductase, NAD(P)H dehydrogenase (quinone)
MSEKIKILAFPGSLRKNSYNRMLINALAELKPENMEIEITDLSEIPLYSGDVEDAGVPASVAGFKEKIEKADGVIISTPEYNHAVSGVLKNALDWASRPPYNPFSGKPVGIMGATIGMSGTISAQENFRHIGVLLNMHTMNNPGVLVSTADKKFDSNGKLTDERIKELLRKYLLSFVRWTEKIK